MVEAVHSVPHNTLGSNYPSTPSHLDMEVRHLFHLSSFPLVPPAGEKGESLTVRKDSLAYQYREGIGLYSGLMDKSESDKEGEKAEEKIKVGLVLGYKKTAIRCHQ